MDYLRDHNQKINLETTFLGIGKTVKFHSNTWNILMTIPEDAENRWWVDVTSANPKLVNEYRPALTSFIAFGPSGKDGLLGTGFVIGRGEDFAFVMTAKHVLSQGAFKIQIPHPRFDPSSFFIPKSATLPKISPEYLKLLWADSNNATMIDCLDLIYNDSIDIACCLVSAQAGEKNVFKPNVLPLDIRIPSVGDVIHMVSHSAMSMSSDNRTIKKTLSVKRTVNIRIGVVTGVYPKGHRQYKWPCFTTSIPAEPGMSGGFITYPEDGKPVSACGVVCADASSDEARRKHTVSGESIIACVWTSLGMTLPEHVSDTGKVSRKSIYNLMRDGHFHMAIGGINEIDLILTGNGDYTIHNRADRS
jgi:hypothetical protein